MQHVLFMKVQSTQNYSHYEPMRFPQTCRFLEAGQGGGWRCGPEQLAVRVPCAGVYSGCNVMARIHNIIRRRTQLLAVFCNYSKTLRVLRWESWSSVSK